jgi:hypothetical protein
MLIMKRKSRVLHLSADFGWNLVLEAFASHFVLQ